MKIQSIALLRWNSDTEEPVVLDGAFNLADVSYFQRGRCDGAQGWIGTGLWCISDDTWLEMDFCLGFPGLPSYCHEYFYSFSQTPRMIPVAAVQHARVPRV